MNPHLKLAYDHGVQQAIIDAGLTKESTFRNLAQYRYGKPFLDAYSKIRTPGEMASFLASPKTRALGTRDLRMSQAGVPATGLSERMVGALAANEPVKHIARLDPGQILRAGGNNIPPQIREFLAQSMESKKRLARMKKDLF